LRICFQNRPRNQQSKTAQSRSGSGRYDSPAIPLQFRCKAEKIPLLLVSAEIGLNPLIYNQSLKPQEALFRGWEAFSPVFQGNPISTRQT
jgi:hypothetical protein